MNSIELGKFIATLRNEKNLTQEELAEKLFIDKRKVSRWECGTSIPDFDMLIKLSEILDVSLYELSICKRIENEKLKRKLINRFKNIKDLKKYNLKKKLLLILYILLGIFFSITTIYTIYNYNTVEIYELVSLDENFYIEGNYIRAREYYYFNIAKISNFKINTNNYNIKLEIFDDNNRIIQSYDTTGSNIKENIIINNNNIKNLQKPIESSKLFLYIYYYEKNILKNKDFFEINLVKIYDNKIL